MTNHRITSYRWVIAGVLWLTHSMGFLNISAFGILAPFIKEEFSLSSFQIGFFISSLSIGLALGQMPAGLIVDVAGVRRIMSLAIGAMSLFLILFSLSPSFPIALTVLLLYGLANSVITPAASKSVIDWFPAVGRATAMGIKQTGINFGGIFAGLLLPTLLILLSWRQCLTAIGLAELGGAILVYLLLKESPIRSAALRANMAWGKILQMATQRDMLILGGIGFFFMAGQFCFSTYLVLFLTHEMRYPIDQAGRFYALSFFIGAVGRVLWSLVSDYLLAGRRKLILVLIGIILFLSSLALGMISFFPARLQLLMTAVFAFGISGIGWNAIYLTILGEAVDRESTGLATGVGYFYGFLGSVATPPLFGFLVDRTDTYGWAWLFLALCAGAILVLLALYREKRRPD